MKFLVLIACLSVANAYDMFIIQGREARVGEFTDLVSLQRNGQHFCGGTLVNKRTVLTAAHCFFDNRQLFGVTVVAGVNDLTQVNSPTRKVYGVEALILHPDYKDANIGDDVCILKLSSDAHIGAPYIAAVSLADASIDINTPPSGTQCFVAGWGAVDPAGFGSHPRKMVGDVKAVTNAACSQSFRSTNNNIKQLCAGGHNPTDSCRGDSGGPLYCTYNGKTVQAGIVSYGSLPCGQLNVPGVYARVSYYRNFINRFSV